MADTAPVIQYSKKEVKMVDYNFKGGPAATRRRATSPYTHPELAPGATPATPFSIQDSMSQVGQLMRQRYLEEQKKKKKQK